MARSTLKIQDGPSTHRRFPRLRKRYLLAAVIVLGFVFVILGFVFLRKSKPSLENPETAPPPSPSVLQSFKRGAVCSDAAICSEIGKSMFLKNGSAVDAAVATMVCNGLVTMQSMGLGGGFLMVVHIKETNETIALNAREAAPLAVNVSMYKEAGVSKRGPLAIAVPGELKGYWAAHKRYGKLPWKELIEPTIKLCNEGYNISAHQFNALSVLKKNPSGMLKTLFFDEQGATKPTKSLVKHTKFCETLQIIADKGGDDLYNGTLAEILLKDLNDTGSIITKEDLEKYEAKWEEPVKMKMKDETFYSAPLPGSGGLIALILNVLKTYNFTKETLENDTILTYHRIVESFKHAFGLRSLLGDPEFNSSNLTEIMTNFTSNEFAKMIRSKIFDNGTSQDPVYYGAEFASKEDHGTSHISVLAPNGDAVSATSTVNLYFGSGIMSPSTGIILNSGMDDFSFNTFESYFGIPYSPANSLAPGKRSLSSMSPSIIVDDDTEDVKMVIGAAGGTKIVSAVAQVIMRILWFGEDVKQAVDARRFHHQIFPMEVAYELGTVQSIVTGLEKLGHKTSRYSGPGSVICALVKQNGTIFGNADYRKGGEVLGLN